MGFFSFFFFFLRNLLGFYVAFSLPLSSKVNLKVEYRDWHEAVLFGAISNMLASKTNDHFPTLLKVRSD